jgi:hypothetical protein
MKAQRLILTFLSLVLLGFVLIPIAQNWETVTPVQVLSETFPAVSLGLLLGLAGLATGLAILCKMGERLLLLGSRQQRTSRELERRDVTAEEAEARARVLESRVQTLEQALDVALKDAAAQREKAAQKSASKSDP